MKILNESISPGIFTDNVKIVKATPTFIPGKRELLTNYI